MYKFNKAFSRTRCHHNENCHYTGVQGGSSYSMANLGKWKKKKKNL